jgi:hypothetical protein
MAQGHRWRPARLRRSAAVRRARAAPSVARGATRARAALWPAWRARSGRRGGMCASAGEATSRAAGMPASAAEAALPGGGDACVSSRGGPSGRRGCLLQRPMQPSRAAGMPASEAEAAFPRGGDACFSSRGGPPWRRGCLLLQPMRPSPAAGMCASAAEALRTRPRAHQPTTCGAARSCASMAGRSARWRFISAQTTGWLWSARSTRRRSSRARSAAICASITSTSQRA